jgi:hypothetical protein
MRVYLAPLRADRAPTTTTIIIIIITTTITTSHTRRSRAWLEEAKKSHREKLRKPVLFKGGQKKRKHRSISASRKH